jgi:mRNA interferase MazF
VAGVFLNIGELIQCPDFEWGKYSGDEDASSFVGKAEVMRPYRRTSVARRRELGGRVQRGEVWWALVDERRPVVLLSGDEASGWRAMQIVAAATAEEKRGFVLLSGEEAADSTAMRQIVAAAGAAVAAVGVEVEFGPHEGLPHEGVVRVALPREGHIFCTWLVTLTREYLIERAGALSPAKLHQLDNALRLAAIE